MRPALRLSCDVALRFFVSLRCQVMIVVTGRLAIKRNAREASFQGVGSSREVQELVVCHDGGLGVGTRVYVHQRSLEYDGRA